MKYLLQGSLQASGDKMRITSQLVDASTGGHIWSQRFDKESEDIFKVQTEVTGSIATTLAAVDAPERFRSSRAVGPHFGLTPEK
ncbi:hypothetical protein [Sinorhizobium meliloti]|uniref:hypothetical protein n=1 Tax=Rhizobium meliloti TaxID=382 RepID=UPI003F5CF930